TKLLLRGGTLLVHDEKGYVNPNVSDLLIEGSTITKIENNIQLTADETQVAKVIDCKGKIISPGFINTHQHLFQSQIKGKPANHTLAEFFTCANLTAAKYTPIDTFWGQLSGALECIDAGTTTVVDHANPNLTEHSKTLIQALATSGLRCVFCYCPSRQTDYASTRSLHEFRALAAAGPFGKGRVQIGFAMDNIYLPGDVIKPYYQAIRRAGAKVITTHGAGGPAFGQKPSALQLLDQHALLGTDILVSHANSPKEGDSALLAKFGAFISSTVSTELQVGSAPIAMMPEFYEYSSLGTDGNGWGAAYMPLQMNMLVQHARYQRAEALAKNGVWSRDVGPRIEEVFNLATIAGARSIGMANDVGRLAVGFKADLLIFAGTTPGMLVAAENDPLAAVVLHSTVRDLETVIVDGIMRKDGGKMLDVQVADEPNDAEVLIETGQIFSWGGIAREVLKSRKAIQQKMKGIDLRAAEDAIMDVYGMDKHALIH
ncbi:amidohydrolase, partial [Pyrenochaeta sp. MPI-SDFR-AT-0127]